MPKIVDHDERRERIVEIVAEMLATVGAEKTTIRESITSTIKKSLSPRLSVGLTNVLWPEQM